MYLVQYKSIFVLGRQPEIGRAELESLFGADHIQPIGEQAAASDTPNEQINFARIGSVVRLARPLFTVHSTSWNEVVQKTAKQVPFLVSGLPKGKLKLGLSVLGLAANIKQLTATGLEFKKICRQLGRSARLVPNQSLQLSSAQALHNQLTGNLGLELLFIKDDQQTLVAQTSSIQDINAYARRDQGRPKRDARVGMLPPKLAQTIVNLAVGQISPNEQTIVLDPFCGTGVILQEALIMGYGAYGTDIEPRMIDFTHQNLEWLSVASSFPKPTLEVGDATTHHWPYPFSAVACETYLGRPLSRWPDREALERIINTCDIIVKKFLSNIFGQVLPGTRMCLAIPAWVAPNGNVRRLPLLDHLGEMGYNLIRFKHSEAENLVYFRPGQIVARELLVITRK